MGFLNKPKAGGCLGQEKESLPLRITDCSYCVNIETLKGDRAGLREDESETKVNGKKSYNRITVS